MRVLLLSFYYPPDIGPGALRAESIAKALVQQEGVQVDVITTFPNRYNSFRQQTRSNEKRDGINVCRIQLPSHHSGIVDQAYAFLTYAMGVRNATKFANYDLIVGTSSRLMTAGLSAWVSRRHKAKLFLDIRDLFTDTLSDLWSGKFLLSIVPIFRYLESWVFKSASGINVVSKGFENYVRHIAPNVKVTVFTNGIDEQFIGIGQNFKSEFNPKIALYAGNIGDGQGMDRIIPAVAAMVCERITFRIVGDGSRCSDLSNLVESMGNVELIAPLPRTDLLEEYAQADILFLHLNNYAAFDRVLPSKIFEYAATGKPILAGVSGYAAEFLQNEVVGVEVFQPCDPNSMRIKLERLIAGPSFYDRSEFCKKYNRDVIIKDLVSTILDSKEKYAL